MSDKATWVLVPRQPTTDMLTDAGTMYGFDEAFLPETMGADEAHVRWWSAMLAARPAPDHLRAAAIEAAAKALQGVRYNRLRQLINGKLKDGTGTMREDAEAAYDAILSALGGA